MPKTSTSSQESGSDSGSAKKTVPTNKHGGQDPWKAVVDHQTKVAQILIAKEKQKKDQTLKEVRNELTILALQKEGKRSDDAEEKTREKKAAVDTHANHVQELRDQKEKDFKKAKSIVGELTIQQQRSQGDSEKIKRKDQQLDDAMVKASKEASQKQLKFEEQKKDTLKKAVTENKMVNEVRKIMEQDKKKEDQSTHKKHAEQAIQVQLNKEKAREDYYRRINNMQESRTTDHAQQVHYNKTQKEQEFEKNVDKHVKAKQDDQNKRFLDSMLKDKQAKNSVGAANRSQMGIAAQNKTVERNEHSKKTQERHAEIKGYASDLIAERQDSMKKQKQYKLALDQQAFNSHEKRRNADEMSHHELKMNQKLLDAYVNDHSDGLHCNLPGFSDSTVARRRTSGVFSRRMSNSTVASGTQSTRAQGGKNFIFNPITGAETQY